METYAKDTNKTKRLLKRLQDFQKKKRPNDTEIVKLKKIKEVRVISN